MLLRELFEAKRKYTGEPLEAGGTSIAGNAAPPIRALFEAGHLSGKVMDFGAGKYARNANYLREKGVKVYAYDPFNGDPNGDGWNTTTTKLPPAGKFDAVFTSYVLNVVPEHIEDQIIQRSLLISSWSILLRQKKNSSFNRAHWLTKRLWNSVNTVFKPAEVSNAFLF